MVFQRELPLSNLKKYSQHFNQIINNNNYYYYKLAAPLWKELHQHFLAQSIFHEYIHPFSTAVNLQFIWQQVLIEEEKLSEILREDLNYCKVFLEYLIDSHVVLNNTKQKQYMYYFLTYYTSSRFPIFLKYFLDEIFPCLSFLLNFVIGFTKFTPNIFKSKLVLIYWVYLKLNTEMNGLGE